jgi:hypothetical protein
VERDSVHRTDQLELEDATPCEWPYCNEDSTKKVGERRYCTPHSMMVKQNRDSLTGQICKAERNAEKIASALMAQNMLGVSCEAASKVILLALLEK